MKNLNFIIIVATIILLTSCEKGDVITGSPIDTNLPVENMVGTISTDATEVVDGQEFLVNVILPNAFGVDTTVEAEVLVPELNSRIRRSVVILAGQTTNELKVSAPSSGAYNLPFNIYTVKVFLTAFNTASNVVPSGFSGKRYSISSNVLNLIYGDSEIPTANPNRLGLVLDFEGVYTGSSIVNDLDVVILKNGAPTVASDFGNTNTVTKPYNGTRIFSGRYEKFNINSLYADDTTYQIALFAKKVITSGSNIDYRFAVRFPDDKVKIYSGTLTNVVVGSALNATQVLKIIKTKSVVAGSTVYDYKVSKLP